MTRLEIIDLLRNKGISATARNIEILELINEYNTVSLDELLLLIKNNWGGQSYLTRVTNETLTKFIKCGIIEMKVKPVDARYGMCNDLLTNKTDESVHTNIESEAPSKPKRSKKQTEIIDNGNSNEE